MFGHEDWESLRSARRNMGDPWALEGSLETPHIARGPSRRQDIHRSLGYVREFANSVKSPADDSRLHWFNYFLNPYMRNGEWPLYQSRYQLLKAMFTHYGYDVPFLVIYDVIRRMPGRNVGNYFAYDQSKLPD